MVNKVLLFRVGTAFAIAGTSFLVSLLPSLIHEMSYNLFDAARVGTCGALLAIGTIYQFSRACQLLEEYHVSFVCIVMSTTLMLTILLEIGFAKKFDALTQRYSSLVNSLVLRGLNVNELSVGYRPVSTLEMHEFSLDTSVDTSIELEEGSGGGGETDELLDDADWGDRGLMPSSGQTPTQAKGQAKGQGRAPLKELRDERLGTAGGVHSALLCFGLVLLVDVFNATIEGISLGTHRHDAYSSLESIIFRQIIVSFAFGATMEALEFGSSSLVLVVLVYSAAVPLGIFIALITPFHLNSLFCGLVSATNAGLLLYFSLFHLLPRDLIVDFEASATNRFKLVGLLVGYAVVVLGTLFFPMQI